MLERPAVKKIQAETDPARALHLWVAMVLDVAGRATPIGQVLVVAADGDDARITDSNGKLYAHATTTCLLFPMETGQ